MTKAPHPDQMPPHVPRRSGAWNTARNPGAPEQGATPRVEHVRITTPDLARRAALGVLQKRMVFGLVGFLLIYGILAGRLIDVSVINPTRPDAAAIAAELPRTNILLPPPARAEITDRNGVILAVSLPGAALYANPKQIGDPGEVARQIAAVIPALDPGWLEARLADRKRDFVYLDRGLTAEQELAVNQLGIPGVYFEDIEHRHYPEGDLAAHILGGVTPDQRGIAGVEQYFNKTLTADPATPLRLSIDIGAEGIVRQETLQAMTDYDGIGACGIVISARTGRVLAMASLPDYSAGDLGSAPANDRFNRCVSGDYEPGSVFKLMTLSMAINSGMIHYWDRFDTTHPLHVGRFTVTDFEPAHIWMAVPHILEVSSNIGASRIATILGPDIQRAWLKKLGFFGKPPIQLPEAQPAMYHPKSNWKLLTTMTVSFGNGIAMSPLQLISAVVPVVNGGVYYKPSLDDAGPPPAGVRVMSAKASLIMRKMMRNVVVAPNGTGVYARVPGYLVGGKTGTAQVVGPGGRYMKHLNNASFMAAFPMTNPRYVVYVVVLQPHATKKMMPFCHGFTTGGYVAAPAVANIIARIGPMLGIMPRSGNALASAQAALSIPVDPTAPPGRSALGPGHMFPPGASKYAYMLAGEKPPAAIDEAAHDAALARTEMWQPLGATAETISAPSAPIIGGAVSHQTMNVTPPFTHAGG
ncbi:MAG: peptidoglycan glycosyltransferase [Acidiphilium sp. 37-64-53]|uniref:peptidoglycan D,D-transpeptidase FtsI family protein n=1 Tax=Acidiphilium TaxID=522 RepID=UPI000BCF821C|nr:MULTISPECIES: penicillin-binding protein 2 [Acidiphilium]OYW04227.1 MAG: peptidoglycan glycosyltransferase [Acidiphilium sp. 37-64-53]OZB31158.1 MAG: peptidoglycan glycosyltransferase [Acidiphilium sp. 34-64-41]HQT83481.1 penicillin-binding protein 2 [Acidiphilium rubrum]